MADSNRVTFAMTSYEIVTKFLTLIVGKDKVENLLPTIRIAKIFTSHDPDVIHGLSTPMYTNGFGDYVFTLSHKSIFGIEFSSLTHKFSFVLLAEVIYDKDTPTGYPKLSCDITTPNEMPDHNPDRYYTTCQTVEPLTFKQYWNEFRPYFQNGIDQTFVPTTPKLS